MLFRAVVKSAIVILLMMRLGRPTGAREMADILGLDEHTVAKHLRSLAQVNLVARSSAHSGYILLGGSQLILGSDFTVKNLQFDPIITRDTDINNESVVIIDSAQTVKNLQFEDNLSPVEQALKEVGISDPKRSELARLTGITPESIKAWEVNLKHEKGERYKPGLLIHMLESGEPTPPVNQIGHHLNCGCEECQRINYLAWYGGDYPKYYDDAENDEENGKEDKDAKMGISDDDCDG